jgi:hypothetical protein
MDEILLQNFNNDPALQAKYPSFEVYKNFMNNPQRAGDGSGLYSIRDQLNRDFLQGGLLRDARDSLGQTFNSLTNDMGSFGQNINQFVTETVPSGLEKLKNFYSKLPTPGNLFFGAIDAVDRFDELPQQDRDYITNIMEGARSDQGLAGFYKDPNSGLLKDMMGKNVRSLRGNYAEYIRKEYDRRFNEQNPNYVNYTTPLQLSKNAFIQKQFQKQEEAAQRVRDQQRIQERVNRGESLSNIGKDMYTGSGKAFEARQDTFTGGKTVSSPSTPGGQYSSPR